MDLNQLEAEREKMILQLREIDDRILEVQFQNRHAKINSLEERNLVEKMKYRDIVRSKTGQMWFVGENGPEEMLSSEEWAALVRLKGIGVVECLFKYADG